MCPDYLRFVCFQIPHEVLGLKLEKFVYYWPWASFAVLEGCRTCYLAYGVGLEICHDRTLMETVRLKQSRRLMVLLQVCLCRQLETLF